jgi:phosphoribosylformylglycinamidine synthase
MADAERRHGATLDLSKWERLPLRALLFGEAQGRVVVSTPDAAALLAIAAAHGVPARRLGVVGGATDDLVLRIGARQLRAPLDLLASAYHEAIPRIMERSVMAAAVVQEPLTARL